jgi:hypothetical protein
MSQLSLELVSKSPSRQLALLQSTLARWRSKSWGVSVLWFKDGGEVQSGCQCSAVRWSAAVRRDYVDGGEGETLKTGCLGKCGMTLG